MQGSRPQNAIARIRLFPPHCTICLTAIDKRRLFPEQDSAS